MGHGDSLMARGDAWKRYQETGKKVAIGDGVTIDPHDHALDYGMEHFLATQEEADAGDVEWVFSSVGSRPYIDYDLIRARLGAMGRTIKKKKLVGRYGKYLYNLNYRPTPAPIVLTEEEQAIAADLRRQGPIVLIEPYIKDRAPPSKQWPVDRFAEVAERLSRRVKVFQISGPDKPTLPGIRRLETASFRHAMAAIAGADVFVGPEGGLHHAAAAVKTRAVVIYGGFTSPLITGYPPLHVNLTGDNEGYACGTRFGLCPHCKRALESITVEEVIAQTLRQLEKARG